MNIFYKNRKGVGLGTEGGLSGRIVFEREEKMISKEK